MANKDLEHGDVNLVPQTVQNLLNLVGQKQNVIKFSPYIIYKVPQTFRELNPTCFTPRVVAIGPLHRKDKNLQQFEVQKAVFVHDLLCRRLDSSPAETLTACVEKVASIINAIRGSYADIASYDDGKLTEMMVMDACFILEFIHEMSKDCNLRLQDQHIPYDLVLLENQIPFFVLESIYECTINNSEVQSLAAFIHPLLQYTNIFEGIIKEDCTLSSNNLDHILAYLHHCYQPENEISSNFPRSTIHSAVELDRARVNFKPKDNDNPKWPIAMEVKMNHSRIFWFSSKCTLTMPKLRIDDFTELVFRNLIAYEQSYGLEHHVTSYARAMNMLIVTGEDIAKLVRSKVIVNHIGSNEEAANIINRLCEEVGQDHFYYAPQFEALDAYFNYYRRTKTAKLKRACYQLKLTYFSSPWSIIALFAGINIFFLTWVQTVYSVKSYFTK